MTFDWPWMLLTLVAVVPLVLGYRRLLRRQESRRRALADLGLVAPELGAPEPVARSDRRAGRRRHLTPALYLTALVLMLLALARPEATVADPRYEGTVVLAFDVSASMAAADLAPTRMAAAKAAARQFVERQPATIKVAVVAFSESGVITQRPTADHAALNAAIERLSPQGGTSLGRGLQSSLTAIVGTPVQLPAPGGVEESGPNLGYHGSAVVILLTDGEDTGGPDPQLVADLASSAGVRVYPVGLGSAQGTVLSIDGFQVATALDEALLRQIATTTDGRYYPAADQQALAQVYDSIRPGWTVQARRIEVTALFGAAAGLALLVGAVLSLVRSGRVI